MTDCWMCDPNQYTYASDGIERTARLLESGRNCYVIVPKNLLVRHHVIVALKQHRAGLISTGAEDLANVMVMVTKWCYIFSKMGYDKVYTGCYSDAGHLHFHLYPIYSNVDKPYKGSAIQWLAERERIADTTTLSIPEIRNVYSELITARQDVEG